MGHVVALYVAMIVSFCFSHVVDMSALSICIVLRALVIVISMRLLYVRLGSRVSPSIFGLMFMGSEKSEMGLYDVPMFMSLFGFGIGMIFASFHV